MDFSVESKYPFRIFEDNDQICSWTTIKVGWDLKRLTIDEIKKFGFHFLEICPDQCNEYVLKLLVSENVEYDFESLLEKIIKSLGLEFPEENSALWNKEWRKWRYCILCEMVKHIFDIQDLLIKVEGVYADFGYPEDMQHFIYYMPSNEVVSDNIEEAQANLIKKLNIFLEEERVRIQEGCAYFPSKI